MSNDDGFDPMQARSDLVSMLSADPKMTKAIVTIIENELRDLKDKKVVSKISKALADAAAHSNVDKATRNGVLYFLTESTPDVRQTILVQTIEELLRIPSSRKATLDALTQISSKNNVDMIMEWVEHQILTLNQAVFVLLYPDSSKTLL